MIKLTCPGCHSKIHAKPELAGQVRRCPKCGLYIRIPVPDENWRAYGLAEAVEPPTEASAKQPAAEVSPGEGSSLIHDVHGYDELQHVEVPDELVPHNRYLICDRTQIVAVWKEGQGWQVRSGSGFVSARRNPDLLPNQGNFQLVELKMHPIEGGVRLVGIRVYQLAERYALPALQRGDSEILHKVKGPGHLTRDQKAAVKLYILKEFMHPVWENANEVLEYLSNTDYHSPGVG